MKYLVTGGAGFIGSHLVDILIKNGHLVRVLDDFSSGSRANLDSVCASPLLEVVEGDVRDAELVGRLVAGTDGIFHQAALVSVQQSLEQPALSFDINVRGTVVVLESARLAGIKRVVLASSAAVYGDGAKSPLSEDAPTNPLTPYALDKRSIEHYAALYHRLYGLETVALRYFNVYGPRQSPTSPYSGVISLFLDQVRRGEGMTVYGDGEQSRDFVHVLDVAQTNIRAMNGGNDGSRIYNVGTGNETSINRLIEVLTVVADRCVSVAHTLSRTGDIRRSCANINRARAELGYQPPWELARGLRSLVRKEEP
jgi:nucleoside-diphosphate-sugar epimerase